MSDIEVTIIVEAYNHEKYLDKCLESLVTQKTNFRYEILINDDMSTDNTRRIIENYYAEFPSMIVPLFQAENQYSKGVSIPFDVLYSEIRGRYIAFCEGDDFWRDENKLQRQYDALEQNKNCSFCVHNVIMVEENGDMRSTMIPQNPSRIPSKDGVISANDFAKLVFCGNYPFQTSSYFFRRELFEIVTNGKLPVQRLTNDDYVLLYLASLSDVYYIDLPMSCYRQNAKGSWSSEHPVEAALEVRERFTSTMKAEAIFGKYVDGKYDELIKASAARYILAWSDVFPEEAKALLKESGVDFKTIRNNLKFKYSVYYVLLYTCPKLHTLLKRYGRRFFGN